MLDRRAFLKAGGVALLTLGAGPTFLERTAWAATGPSRKTLVTLFQRGAMDGIMAVQPLADPHLQKLRPRLALQANNQSDGLSDLGNGFGLHPALADLLPAWKERRLAVVHAVGSPENTRSHFDAQDYMESGTPGRKGTPDGWLNRVSGQLGHDATPFRAIAMGTALPRSLAGQQPALALTNLREFKVDLPTPASSSDQGFEALYQGASQKMLRETAAETFEAIEVLQSLDIAKYRPLAGVRYPASPLGQSLKQIAFLIKAQIGLQVAFAESGGWDTHVQQGNANGTFARRARDLAQAIAAFDRDLGPFRQDVVLMTMTEFGRTVAENGSGGTDHGHGSCLFVLGDPVQGGQIHGKFPGIHPEQLFEGRDLAVTTDFRAVFAGVAGELFGIHQPESLFPGYVGSPLSLLTHVAQRAS